MRGKKKDVPKNAIAFLGTLYGFTIFQNEERQ